MAREGRVSVRELAREAGHQVDEVLLCLWSEDFMELSGPHSLLSGKKLAKAKSLLGLPKTSELTSIEFWRNKLNCTQSEFESLLQAYGVSISRKARMVPAGAIRKLKNELILRRTDTGQKQVYAEPSCDLSQTPALALVDKRAKRRTELIKKQVAIPWRIVGRICHYKMLDVPEVTSIHEKLCLDFAEGTDPISPPGARSESLLESAVFRPHTAIGDERKYPTIEMGAAALLHSLIHNHPFHNGNKRAALVSMLVFLDKNGYILTCTDEELFRFVLRVAQHRPTEDGFRYGADEEVMVIAEWVRANSRALQKGEHPISFNKLRKILNRYGCEFEFSNTGSHVKISRNIKKSTNLIFRRTETTKLVSSSYYGGEGREVYAHTLGRIRAELELDEEHGIDSRAFYGSEESVASTFIEQYRKILRKLAKI